MGKHGNTGTQDSQPPSQHSWYPAHTNILASGTLLEELPSFCDKTDLRLHQTWAPGISSTTPCSGTPGKLKAMFQLSLYLPQCQSTGQRGVTLCWLSPEQNYCKMTCLCHTFQLKGLASRLWSMPRTHCCGSAESCGHFLSGHLADRLKVARYDHFRKLSYHEKQRFVCNERGTSSLVGAI